MAQKAEDLIPDAALIYERCDGVVYARYRDPPHNTKPRWIVGGTASGMARAQGRFLDYSEWNHLCELSDQHPTLKSQLEKLLDIYHLVREQT